MKEATIDINNLAPVLITVYDRFDCIQNAIDSLKKNDLAKYTDLYIASDYAYEDSHKPIIEEIRAYINSIKGFKKVEGIFWDKNKGSFDSCMDAINYIFSKYDKIITFEDDILVSNRFLEYMNKALDFYKDDTRIMSIASHTRDKDVTYKGYPYEVYLLRMYSPWGSAIWKDRFECIDYSLKDINEFLNNKQEIKRFNAISRHMLPLINDMLEKGKKYGDVIVCYNMFKMNKLTLYPIKPLSVNRGHDGRGEHCGKDEIWQNQQLVNDFCPQMIENPPLDSKIQKNVYKSFFSYKRDVIEVFLKKIGMYESVRYVYKKMKNKIKKG